MNENSDNKRLTVLALDDSLAMREALSVILAGEYDLRLSKNFSEFDSILNREIPHIILLDLHLPDANGIEICEALRNKKKYDDVAIIIITGDISTKTIENGYSAGADDFLRKPIIAYELKSKIQIFERIIRSKLKLKADYYAQLDYNKKLNILNQIVQENLSIRDSEASFRTAEHLSEVIEMGYIEIVKKDFDNYSTILSKYYFEKENYRSFIELNRILRVTDKIRNNIETMKIKSGSSTIHCAVSSLILNGEIFGYILLENQAPFSENDKKIITLFTNFFSIINSRFSVEREIEKMNHDYKIEVSKIRKMQVASLPEFDQLNGYDMSSAFLPAQDISGDFFEGFFLDEETYQIILCDVSGHGIASAYVGNQIRTLIRKISSSEISPAELAKSVNDSLAVDLKGLYYFATMLICQIKYKNGEINYVNAGHPPMLLYRTETGECIELEHTGPLIGLFENNEYEESSISLNEGDTIVLYTDGIPEAAAVERTKSGDMYGEERLKNKFIESQSLSCRDLIHSILGSLYEFTEYSEQEDDITIICMRKNGEKK